MYYQNFVRNVEAMEGRVCWAKAKLSFLANIPETAKITVFRSDDEDTLFGRVDKMMVSYDGEFWFLGKNEFDTIQEAIDNEIKETRNFIEENEKKLQVLKKIETTLKDIYHNEWYHPENSLGLLSYAINHNPDEEEEEEEEEDF